MKTTIRAILVLGLVWALAGAPEALLAARKRGAGLRMTLTSKEVVQGELIGVRGETLVLLTDKGDRSVVIGEVDTLLVKDLSGTLIGGSVGVTAGVVWDVVSWHDYKKRDPDKILATIFAPATAAVLVLVPAAGLLSGMLVGHAVHKGKTYEIRKMAPSEVQGLLEGLRKKAMVPDYK